MFYLFSFRKDIQNKTVSEKQYYILLCISSSVRSIDASGNIKLAFQVKVDQSTVVTVCRDTFARLCDVSTAGFNRLVLLSKVGATSAETFNDSTNVQRNVTLSSLKVFAKQFGADLTDRQLGLIQIPSRSTEAKALVDWLHKFVTVAGCVNPVDGKIQIELCSRGELYNMYLNDFNLSREAVLSQNRFNALFRTVFPFVQVRKKKSVTGEDYLTYLLFIIYYYYHVIIY